jgi:hypothetical protein
MEQREKTPPLPPASNNMKSKEQRAKSKEQRENPPFTCCPKQHEQHEQHEEQRAKSKEHGAKRKVLPQTT